MLNTDPLFELNRLKEKIIETPRCTFDILKEEGGAIFLTRDGGSADVIIGPTYMDHFKRVGELGFLRGKALDKYEEMYGRRPEENA